MDIHAALILRRMVIVLTAEELMKKKGTIKQELDAQTAKSNELWQKSTDKLSEILKHYGDLPKGLQPHINKIFLRLPFI